MFQFSKFTAYLSLAALTLALPLTRGAPADALPPAEAPPAFNGRGSVVLELPIAHPTTLLAATKGGEGLPYAIVGYRYLNVGVEGEFFPTADYPIGQFATDFHQNFGMDPSIVGLIVRGTRSSSGVVLPIQKMSKGSVAVPAQGTLLSATPHFTPGASQNGTAWEAMRIAVLIDSTANDAAQGTSPSIAAATTDWHPDVSRLSLSTASGGQAIISTQNAWTAGRESTSALPDFWGLEFKVDLKNKEIAKTIPSATRQEPAPYCLRFPDVEDRFWAKNYDWMSWSVFQVGATTATTLGAYADQNDLGDLCSRQALSIGIGFPKKIPLDPGGNQQLGTMIVAPKGTSGRVDNIVTGSIAAKEGKSCIRNSDYESKPYSTTYYKPTTDCMGVQENMPFPTGISAQNLLILSERGAAYSSSPLVRKQVVTTEQGLAAPACVSRYKAFFKDAEGYSVPQRVCDGV